MNRKKIWRESLRPVLDAMMDWGNTYKGLYKPLCTLTTTSQLCYASDRNEKYRFSHPKHSAGDADENGSVFQ